MLFPVIVAACMLGILLGGNYLSQEKGIYNRPDRSIVTTLFNRTSWAVLMKNEYRWPSVFTENVSYESLYQSSLYPADLVNKVEPELENALGYREAQKVYWAWTKANLDCHFKEILVNCSVDFADSFCAPVITNLRLNGLGYESFAYRNLDVMKRTAPVLTTYYWNYGSWWFAVVLCVSAVLWLLRSVFVRRRPAAKEILFGALVGVTVLSICFCVMMSGDGMQDYKKVIFVTGLWIWGMMSAIPGKEDLTV